MGLPVVSVVMGVYNGGEKLDQTVQSILRQTYQNFEFLIIDDGSTDDTKYILQQLEKSDSRIKVIHQENKGLTKSLIVGCEMARGRYIARQDNGDFSEPDRLRRQVQFLENDHTFNAVSPYVSHRAPCGERLQIIETTEAQLFAALKSQDVQRLHGPPHHGAVMFRNSAYQQCGGYREQFYFTQDLDLWTRMIELGHHGIISASLYNVTVFPDGISWVYNTQQDALKLLIAKAITLRKTQDDDDILARAADIKPSSQGNLSQVNLSKSATRKKLAEGHYFIGASLLKNSPGKARKYLLESIRLDKLKIKAVIKYGQSWLF